MMSNKYKSVLRKKYMTMLIFVVAANAVLAGFGFNVFNKIDSLVGDYFSKVIYFITGISIVLLGMEIQTFLPFLGETVFPFTLIPETKNVGDTTITIKVTPNTKVAYWSSLPSTDENPPVVKAYGDYSNAGVSTSDKDGHAILTFNKGTGYTVPSGKFIKPHIHYRELNGEYSMIGPVKTVSL